MKLKCHPGLLEGKVGHEFSTTKKPSLKQDGSKFDSVKILKVAIKAGMN